MVLQAQVFMRSGSGLGSSKSAIRPAGAISVLAPSETP
jgi:hypothetical protein